MIACGQFYQEVTLKTFPNQLLEVLYDYFLSVVNMKSDSREIEVMESKHVLVNTGVGNGTLQVETGVRYYDPMNGKSPLLLVWHACSNSLKEMATKQEKVYITINQLLNELLQT